MAEEKRKYKLILKRIFNDLSVILEAEEYRDYVNIFFIIIIKKRKRKIKCVRLRKLLSKNSNGFSIVNSTLHFVIQSISEYFPANCIQITFDLYRIDQGILNKFLFFYSLKLLLIQIFFFSAIVTVQHIFNN